MAEQSSLGIPVGAGESPLDCEVWPDVGRLSLWNLMWRQLLRNRLAVAGGVVLIIFYTLIIFAEFFAPYDYLLANEDYVFLPPQWPRFIDQNGQFHLRPFVYGMEAALDPETYAWVHKPNFDEVYYVHLFSHGFKYRLLGLFETDIHLFGVDEPGAMYLFGADRLGRDLLSRALFGARVSLTVGLVGVALTIVFGSTLGTISGYFGGVVDTGVQRVIEFLMSFPSVPLWAALAAALPPDWSSIKRYFAISIILSLISWTSLARQVRAKVLSYREIDYASAARAVGASTPRIIFVHMLPNALSHIIVVATLSIPWMILGETSLSFLGLGITPPLTSWGALLQDAQRVSVILEHPWLMIPGLFVIVAVLAYNFVGDGLRDAADPFAI
jgi:peptide/nickel transport system permease protein